MQVDVRRDVKTLWDLVEQRGIQIGYFPDTKKSYSALTPEHCGHVLQIFAGREIKKNNGKCR